MASSVLLAVGEVDSFIQNICEKSRSLQLGKDMGAIISKESLDRLCLAIDRAEKAGAKILVDGRKFSKPSLYSQGFWLAPTVLDFVSPDSEAAQHELFGPILSIIRTKNLSQALEIENKNPFGNAAAVFTSSGAIAERVAKEARAGMVGINVGVPVPREPFSFGGLYESKFGYGDITGRGAVDFWTSLKKVTTKWTMPSDYNWMS